MTEVLPRIATAFLLIKEYNHPGGVPAEHFADLHNHVVRVLREFDLDQRVLVAHGALPRDVPDVHLLVILEKSIGRGGYMKIARRLKRHLEGVLPRHTELVIIVTTHKALLRSRIE